MYYCNNNNRIEKQQQKITQHIWLVTSVLKFFFEKFAVQNNRIKYNIWLEVLFKE